MRIRVAQVKLRYFLRFISILTGYADIFGAPIAPLLAHDQ